MDSFRFTRSSDTPYTRLQIADDDIDDLQPAKGSRSVVNVQNHRAWIFFVSCCIIALAVSSLNLTLLSATSGAKLAASLPLKTPSVYLGLEGLPSDPSYCRSRGTFPKTFYTFNPENPKATLYRIHAPDDKTSMSFGGPVSSRILGPKISRLIRLLPFRIAIGIC